MRAHDTKGPVPGIAVGPTILKIAPVFRSRMNKLPSASSPKLTTSVIEPTSGVKAVVQSVRFETAPVLRSTRIDQIRPVTQSPKKYWPWRAVTGPRYTYPPVMQ